MKTCDGCGYESADDDWMHTFDHPLKGLGSSPRSFSAAVTLCGFCYASTVGGRIGQYPGQYERILDELYAEATRQNNVLRDLIIGRTT